MSTVICPLVFSFNDTVIGNGYIAHVAVSGRASLIREGGRREIWMYGVEPGSIAGGATDQHGAMCEFKKSYLSVLFDIANEAATFEVFETEVRKFVAADNPTNEEYWRFGVRSFRAGNIKPALRSEQNADRWRPEIVITRVDREPKPDQNGFDEIKSAT